MYVKIVDRKGENETVIECTEYVLYKEEVENTVGGEKETFIKCIKNNHDEYTCLLYPGLQVYITNENGKTIDTVSMTNKWVLENSSDGWIEESR